MLRELTIEEMDFVSGGVGDIVVTGSTMTSRNSINEFFDNASAWNSILQNASNAVLDADSADDYGQEEIIVNGMTRNDPSSGSFEVVLERDYLHMIGGGYGNAEQNADGTWSIVASFLPTTDQARLEANQSAANTALMVALIDNSQARADLATALTDRGLNMSGQNLAALYQEYRSSSSSGSGLTAFVHWVADRVSQPPLGN